MNKKVMVLVVILECIVSILLIAIMGIVVEAFTNETEAEEVHFLTSSGEVMAPGHLYKEQDGSVREVDNDQIIIEVYRPDRGYQLHWEVITEKTTDKSVTFLAISQNPDVEVKVDEDGFVHFDDDVVATVTVSTKNGRTATVLLIPRQKEKVGNVTLE